MAEEVMLSRRSLLKIIPQSAYLASSQQILEPKGPYPVLTPTESMMHSTVRIECVAPNGAESSGTGFFYSLFKTNDKSITVIVTNKHVLDANIKATFNLTAAKADGTPDLGHLIRVEVSDLQSKWIGHPDPNIDLAIISLAEVFLDFRRSAVTPFFVSLDQSIIPTEEILSSLTPVEDVLVVGYPDGIWDPTNNAPVFRRGITATAPYLKFGGETKFLVDCSIFPGSSGSPVFLFNRGSYGAKDGGLTVGTRVLFLGVIYAVALHNATGQLVIEQAPTAVRSLPITAIPNNLGLCVMASRVMDFEPLMVKMGIVPPPNYKMRGAIPQP